MDKNYLNNLFKYTSVFAEFNSYGKYLSILLYRMRNNFKLGYDTTQNPIEYLIILVTVIL